MKLAKFKKEVKFFFKKQIDQDFLYKPSEFWNSANLKIYNSIIKNGNIKKFKSMKINLNFFIPTYKYFFDINRKFLKKFFKEFSIIKKKRMFFISYINGYQGALSDYRTFRSSIEQTDQFGLLNFNESNHCSPAEQFKFEGKCYSKSALNYLLGMSFLQNNTKKFYPKVILEIGGGYGTLGEILKHTRIKNFKYIDVDIVPMISIAKFYLSKVYKLKKFQSFDRFEKKRKIKIKNLDKINFLCPWHLKKLEGKISLFINFISFQEMEPEIVKNYLSIIQNLKPEYILLKNLKEGKNTKFKGDQINSTYSRTVLKPVKSILYFNQLRKLYKLVKRDVYSFGEKKIDGYNSEILLFKKRSN